MYRHIAQALRSKTDGDLPGMGPEAVAHQMEGPCLELAIPTKHQARVNFNSMVIGGSCHTHYYYAEKFRLLCLRHTALLTKKGTCRGLMIEPHGHGLMLRGHGTVPWRDYVLQQGTVTLSWW